MWSRHDLRGPSVDARPPANVVDGTEIAELPTAAYTDARVRGAGSGGATSSPVGYLPFTGTRSTVSTSHPSPLFGSLLQSWHPVSAEVGARRRFRVAVAAGRPPAAS